MLGLADQVGGDELRGSAQSSAIDQDLGRPGEQVDADLAEELALGLGDVGVARPDEHVDALDRLGPERERGDRLDAAEDADLVGARPACIAATVARVGRPVEGRRAGRRRGSTPATLAVTTLMCAEATIG